MTLELLVITALIDAEGLGLERGVTEVWRTVRCRSDHAVEELVLHSPIAELGGLLILLAKSPQLGRSNMVVKDFLELPDLEDAPIIDVILFEKGIERLKSAVDGFQSTSDDTTRRTLHGLLVASGAFSKESWWWLCNL